MRHAAAFVLVFIASLFIGGLLAWLHGLLDSGYVAEAALDRLVVVDDVDAAMAACAPGDSGH